MLLSSNNCLRFIHTLYNKIKESYYGTLVFHQVMTLPLKTFDQQIKMNQTILPKNIWPNIQ